MSVHIFGIRHHGPGCARALRAALEVLAPDCVLVEGPPDGQQAIPLLAHPEMCPPVALLIYAPERLSTAVYYPFTVFSPEWQALTYALAHDVPARFIDLPQAVRLAKLLAEPSAADQAAPAAPAGMPDGANPPEPDGGAHGEPAPEQAPISPREDPLALLANAAGYHESELWWEHQIEQRRSASGIFEGILEAMTALRADLTPADEEEARREAQMRQGIRKAEREGFRRIAVVCGAWHAPALAQRGAARDDAALLAGLKRAKVAATWIPWTNSRLAARSGYGAGVAAPGWYEHVWTAPDHLTTGWMARVAAALRTEGLDASSANVIEAVRLAETLAAVRNLHAPGLAEMHDAAQATLCGGEPAPMKLIRARLEIGERLGEVPRDTPVVPLQRDLDAQVSRLRLERSPVPRPLELDLRKETDRARSQLLHRLRLLGVDWGTPARATVRHLGTFAEHWQLQWHVEFAVRVIEANVWGSTVAAATTAYIRHKTESTDELAELTSLLDRVILAELPGAVEHLLDCLCDRAAMSSDVGQMMAALPPLARVARYGDVRGTGAEQVLPVFAGLFTRIVIGLPAACAALDDDAAEAMVKHLERAQGALVLVRNDRWLSEWQTALHVLLERDGAQGVHGLVRGRCCRLLLEQSALNAAEVRRLAGLALSAAVPATTAAAWIEGVVRGSGMRLLAQDGLWSALDAWLAELSEETFTALLPLLRRGFAGFSAPERRKMGEKVRRLRGGPDPAERQIDEHAWEARFDSERASLVLPVLAHILGVTNAAE